MRVFPHLFNAREGVSQNTVKDQLNTDTILTYGAQLIILIPTSSVGGKRLDAESVENRRLRNEITSRDVLNIVADIACFRLQHVTFNTVR
jgi:hypothetical protein